MVEEKCKALGVNVVLSRVWAEGGAGGTDLAREVVRLCEEKNDFHFVYPLDISIKEKIEAVATKIYHADDVVFESKAEKQLKELEALGFNDVPVCMAKTQYSFSDRPELKGAPKGFKITVKDLKIDAGAGFIVVKTGDIMTMPGLPKVPAAENIDVDNDGRITGLF